MAESVAQDHENGGGRPAGVDTRATAGLETGDPFGLELHFVWRPAIHLVGNFTADPSTAQVRKAAPPS
jgi:hypothetical protein